MYVEGHVIFVFMIVQFLVLIRSYVVVTKFDYHF